MSLASQFEITKDHVLKKYTGDAEEICIPEGVEIIDDFAFRDNKKLKTVHIPDSVITIAYGAFQGCTALKTVHFGKKVTLIGEQAFYHCEALESAIFTHELWQVRAHAFAFCNSLKIFRAGDGLATIGVGAFYRTGLCEVTLGKNVKKIEDSAFTYSHHLKTIALGEQLQIIGEKAFYGSALQEIHLPKSLEQIGRDAFAECRSLTKVTGNTCGPLAFAGTPYTWRSLGLCRHCGGVFKGLFTQKCRECGQKKDY